MNFELPVTAGNDEEEDEELVGDISIARNFQNKVEALSIYGRQGLLDELERAMQKHDSKILLRKNETDFAEEKLDTEKLIQVITALTPASVPLPSAEQRKIKTPETLYRVYAYRHRSRCLKDFAEVMDDTGDEKSKRWSDAREFFLDVAVTGWRLYQRLKGEQSFNALKMVKGEMVNGNKVVDPDGVPDGLVFPMLSALSRFTRHHRGNWQLDVPKAFPWATLFEMARLHVTSTAAHNPNAMGKDADIYMALRGAIDMYFAVMESK